MYDLLFSPALIGGALAFLGAVLLYARETLTRRSLKITLGNIRLNAEIAAAEAQAARVADQLQAQKIAKIEELSIGTHTLVNSQRDVMRQDMAAQKLEFEQQLLRQKVEFERVIAQLRADLRLAEVAQAQAQAQAPAPAPAPAPAGEPIGQTVTIPSQTVPVQGVQPPENPGFRRTPQG